MPVATSRILLNTNAYGEMVDLTQKVQEAVTEAGFIAGIVTVFVPGSTASITTIEYEPGLISDMPRTLERMVPSADKYEHDRAWGDGNGHSHVKASIVGPGIVVPFESRRLMLGTWQQIVLIDFDNRPRNREVIVQVMGE